jgi:hypothetical protein
MNAADRRHDTREPVREPDSSRHPQTAQAQAFHGAGRAPQPVVDPFDTPGEGPVDEPGYGHGV